MTLVTVVICTKDRDTDTKELVRNLATQTHPPDQLVVVDGGANTTLAEFFAAAAFPWEITYLHTAADLTRQRNVGVAHSKGDIIFFFDDDVILETTYIKNVLQVLERDPEHRIGAVTGRILYDKSWIHRRPLPTKVNLALRAFLANVFLHNRSGSGRFRYSGFPTHPQDMTESCYIQCVSGGLVAFRREVFSQIRFDENLRGYASMEDADISKQLMDAGYRAYYQASARLHHKKSRGGRLNRRQLFRMAMLHHHYLFRKNWPQNPLRKLAFWWSVLGLVVINLRHREQRRGVLEGIRVILSHKTALEALRSV